LRQLEKRLGGKGGRGKIVTESSTKRRRKEERKGHNVWKTNGGEKGKRGGSIFAQHKLAISRGRRVVRGGRLASGQRTTRDGFTKKNTCL